MLPAKTFSTGHIFPLHSTQVSINLRFAIVFLYMCACQNSNSQFPYIFMFDYTLSSPFQEKYEKYEIVWFCFKDSLGSIFSGSAVGDPANTTGSIITCGLWVWHWFMPICWFRVHQKTYFLVVFWWIKTRIKSVRLNMTQLLLLGKFEYTGGPIFKVVLEC